MRGEKKMNYTWPKNRATSRRSGQRRDVTKRGTKRRHDVRGNVATLQRVGLTTSRC